MVNTRYRLGEDVMEVFNNLVLQEAGDIALPSATLLINTEATHKDESAAIVSEKHDLNDKVQESEVSDNNETVDTKDTRTPEIATAERCLLMLQ